MCKFSHAFEEHVDIDGRVIRLECLDSESGERRSGAKIAPGAGSNLFGLEFEGQEYLVGAIEHEGNSMLLGTPVLYPSPNRVRNARFVFEGQVFEFEANEGTNFLHGLVQRVPWQHATPFITSDGVSVKTSITFEPGKEIYDLFPIRNRLEITYTLMADGIRLDFQVINLDSEKRLPFGLGIHPFFNVIGPRERIKLQVPAEKWMEAVDLLPTGELVDLQEGPADMREPTPLSDVDLDDVFYGMAPEKPQVIYYETLGKKLTLKASAFFTHTCIFSPPHYPFFCVENQSCSTDAHNLYDQGLKEAAHLAVLNPGESLVSWVEITLSEL
jgi:aldose 1-epimerase